MSRRFLVLLVAPLIGCASQPPSTVDWPVYQGNHDHTHYTTLSQITPANVAQLKVAWTYDTKDAFPGSEMQSNPVIVNGVMYAMTPKQRAFALDAATGKELWSFDPTGGRFTGPRIRYRGIVVHDGRVYFNYRYRVFSIDAKTGLKVPGWGNDSGWVDLRAGLGRPVEGLSVSASTPGVVYKDMLIIGTSVPEALPSAPGDVRAYDVKTGALRWSFHTIPHPGEFGYETWPPNAWKIRRRRERVVGRHGGPGARHGLLRHWLRVVRLLRSQPARRQPFRQLDRRARREHGKVCLALTGTQA